MRLNRRGRQVREEGKEARSSAPQQASIRRVGISELKANLSEILDAVEVGQGITITRHGRTIAHMTSLANVSEKERNKALETLLNIPLTRLPKGVTIRSLIEEGRR